MRISVFGLGYVGAVSGACLADLGHDVVGVDISQSKIDMINAGEAPIVEELISEITKRVVLTGKFKATRDAVSAIENSEVSLVSVGTPTAADGTPNLDYVDEVMRQIGAACKNKKSSHTVVIRSTVPPGSTKNRFAPILEEFSGKKLGSDLNIAFNPEFLREGKSVSDFRDPPFTIVGSTTKVACENVAKLYEGIECEFIETEPGVAESIKLLSNAWHGLKVAFANEAGRILNASDVDSRSVMDVFIKDTVLNISPAYLRPGFAFGGSCLPKDLRALVSMAERRAISSPIMRAALQSNKDHIDQAVEMIRTYGRRPIVLFGLAFKPGTDDLRESPFVALAERLIGKGYDLKIVDPFVEASNLMGKNREFIEREIPHFVDLLVEDAEAAIDHSEIIIFGHAPQVNKEAIVERGLGKVIIDLSGDKTLEDCGADYQGICW